MPGQEAWLSNRSLELGRRFLIGSSCFSDHDLGFVMQYLDFRRGTRVSRRRVWVSDLAFGDLTMYLCL